MRLLDYKVMGLWIMEVRSDNVMELLDYDVIKLIGFDYLGFDRTFSNKTHEALQ